ncbi:MAG TPA: cytochrome c-type biogenesis protein CcmH [Thermomicrobiales bacterium]|nr:cytochrome c-type biogenesis protein CcmH [Thermomicrobiales bacterium]
MGGLRLLLALLLACALGGALAGGARADALDDEVRQIAEQLRCPVCQGETVADSQAPISVQMRGIIREKLQAGETRDQILQYFVARYGVGILADPPARGFTLGVWVVPIVVLVVGLGLVFAVLRGWLRGPARAAAPATPDGGATPAALPATDDERLERELERFRREGAHG